MISLVPMGRLGVKPTVDISSALTHLSGSKEKKLFLPNGSSWILEIMVLFYRVILPVKIYFSSHS